jgi:outer membrane protein OmpA-like peptidoglycan-associated protein
MININPIYFDKDKDFIRPDAAAELDKIVAVMQEYPNMVIELGSHTDCRASQSYNMKLSDRRAKSSAAYIVSKGIDKKRISGKGYGESELTNDCECEGNKKSDCSEEQHQLNRRTVFKIVKM